jgi:glycosyltransferase involved in cell wall biosynthesis/tetratricopeptide (TPR) repeat protein
MPMTAAKPIGDPAPSHARALEHVHAGDARAAIQALTDHLARHPDHAPAMSDLAVLLHGENRTDQAIGLLERACAGDPDGAPAWENLLDLLLLRERRDEAVRVVQSWLRARPDAEPARVRARAFGLPLTSAGAFAPVASDPRDARRRWLDAVRAAPDDPGLLDTALSLLEAEAGLGISEPRTDGPAAPEHVARDVAELHTGLLDADGRFAPALPFAATLTSDDPVGDAPASLLDEVGLHFDLGNAALFTRTAEGARRCRRAGLDVRASLDAASPEEILAARAALAARTPLSPHLGQAGKQRPETAPAHLPLHLPYPESALDLDRRAAVVALLRRRLPAGEQNRILEVGAGEGRNLADLAGFGPVLATDRASWKLDVARVRAAGANVEYLVVDTLASRVALDDPGPFVAVVCLDEIARLTRFDRETAQIDLASRLAPGGILITSFANRSHPEDIGDAVTRYPDEIERDARTIGLSVVGIVPVGRGIRSDEPLAWIVALAVTENAPVACPPTPASMLPHVGPSVRPAPAPLPVLESLPGVARSGNGRGTPPLLWCGAALTPGGYATYNRNSILWLRRAGVRVGCRNHDEPNRSFLATLPRKDLFELKSALHERVRNGLLLINYQPALPTGHNVYRQMRWQHPEQLGYVGLTTFETHTMPTHWVAPANEMDEIWVPSSFSIDAFVRAGVAREKLKAIGFAIDPDLYDPSTAEPAEIPDRRAFVFYSVFQWHGRKGWRILIEAFARAFAANADVMLVLKTMPGANGSLPVDAQIDTFLGEIGLDRARVAPIHVIDHAIGEDELRRLYFAADAFVLPTRGEGWGIPYMEAMACGLPTIGTRWSGHLDFMNDNNSYLIDNRGLVPVDREMLAFSREYAGQMYADPDTDHLIELMRHVREHPDEARARGRRAFADIRESWTPERYVERVLEAARGIDARIGDNRRRASMSAKPDRLPSISYHGAMFEATGASHDARTLAGQLSRIGAPMSIEAVHDRQRVQAIPEDEAAELLDRMLRPSIVIEDRHPQDLMPIDPDRYNIARARSRGDRLPACSLSRLLLRDEVWVPSRFHMNVFEQSGVPRDRLHRVPLGVDVTRFTPEGDALDIPGARSFRFLSCLDLHPDKGWDVLVRAFLAAFGPEDDASLVLNVASTRSRLPGEIRETVMSFAREAGRARWGHEPLPIHILDCTLDPEDVPALYRSAHAYVLPARASSSGVCALEAMACGKPLVAVGWGPHLDFATDDTALLVDHDLVPASFEGRAERFDLCGVLWAEPRLDAMRAQLRRLYEDAALTSRLGRGAREKVVGEFSIEAVREAALVEIRRIGRTADGSRVAPPALKVCWRGPFEEVASLSLVNSALAAQLESRQAIAVERRDPADDRPTSADVVISHSWPPAFRPPQGTRRHVLILPWEYGRIPPRWVDEIAANVDEVWVPTHHVFEGLIASGVPASRVQVIPNGFDHEVFEPLGPPIGMPTRKAFKFLFVGGLIWRKGLDLLMAAYDATFGPQHDVSLVLKNCGERGVYSKCSGADQVRERIKRTDLPEVVLIDEDLSDIEMAALYRACDVLVHPYRAEGFAMPVAEACACGLPVIVTDGGATSDFVTEKTGFLVASERVPFTTEAPYEADGWVLEPDAHDLAARMVEVHQNRSEAAQRGLMASERLTLTLNWSGIGDAVAARLRAIS